MMSSSRTATDPSTSPSNPSGHLPVGRKLDPAWSQVDLDPEGGVWCKKCNKLIQSTKRTHVERVKHHLAKKCANRASTSLITAMFSPKLKPGVIKVFQEQLALWIYNTGMALYKVEHQSLLDALQLLTPGIEVSSRDQLSTVLLDRAYLKSLKLMEVSLQGKVVTVSSDGWTDICGRAAILAAEAILHSLVSARDFLSAKTKAKKKTRREIFYFVTSTDFVPQLTKAVKILNPIGVSLKRLEEDAAPISSVYKLFIDLPSEMEETGLSSGKLKAVKTLIKTRFDFVYGDAHGRAYLLDPRYAGKGMGMLTRTAVEEFLGSWHGDDKTEKVVLELARFQAFLAEFKMKSKRRWQLLCDQKLPVYAFWCWLNEFSLLQAVATQLFRCATSSSASVRNFSSHVYIHSKLRNRLSPDRVEKLVHIFFNARNINEEELATLSHLEDLLRGEQDDESSHDDEPNRDDDFVYY
ncbi:unnamed protein product [Phytophthora fragariaefolia]|uniref:Unnamed protein product n=1 Tax=Phytophthora fragariaefolia TaxID=1490495 RepID=A0A9W7DFA5_9STRA|nr:unnamed protein product [Phytophthora fragariaefolia]